MTEEEIQLALDSKRNLFITGAAGTGKSYTLNKYIRAHKDSTIVCAPTGIAALRVGGETMHKAFNIPVPAFEPPRFSSSNKKGKGVVTNADLNLIAKADTIIVDEISMARNDVFRYMARVIRKAEEVGKKKIRLIVCGDFSQLKPVVKQTDIPILEKFGLDPSGYPFTTREWASFNFLPIVLTEVHRQEDSDFIANLAEIRKGCADHLDYWNQFVDPEPDYSDAVVVCGTNAEATRINTKYLNELPGKSYALTAKQEGRINVKEIDEVIVVKEGCKVIFTSNDNAKNKRRYRNGSFGTILKVHDDYIDVDVCGKRVPVEKQKFTSYEYKYWGGELIKEEAGSITQYPFKAGKAITVHRSQGQTLDKVILSPDIFASGQLYVALSRVRSPKGLSLLSPVLPKYLITDEKVEKFYEQGYQWTEFPKQTHEPQTTIKRKPTHKTASLGKSGRPKTTKNKKKRATAVKTQKKNTGKKTATKKVKTGSKKS